MLDKKMIYYILALPYFLYGAVPIILDEPHILSYVKKQLPHEGILRQTSEGFLYIELPKEYIFNVLPLIAESRLCPPPYFEEGKVGAHITVATAEEMAALKKRSIPCLGQKIPFNVSDFAQVIFDKESVLGQGSYMLIVDSPKIQEIRKKLGLPPTPDIKGFVYHITIGVIP